MENPFIILQEEREAVKWAMKGALDAALDTQKRLGVNVPWVTTLNNVIDRFKDPKNTTT